MEEFARMGYENAKLGGNVLTGFFPPCNGDLGYVRT